MRVVFSGHNGFHKGNVNFAAKLSKTFYETPSREGTRRQGAMQNLATLVFLAPRDNPNVQSYNHTIRFRLPEWWSVGSQRERSHPNPQCHSERRSQGRRGVAAPGL